MWSVRPSELLFIKDEYTAYCFDQACGHFGMSIEAEMDSVKGKTDEDINRKRYQVLARMLKLPDKKRFRQMKPPTVK